MAAKRGLKGFPLLGVLGIFFVLNLFLVILLYVLCKPSFAP